MKVGFIGLGAMGSAMARNIAAAGHQVRAYNRSGGEIDGVEMVATPAEAFQAEVVFTMLSDDAVIREVILDAGLLEGAAKGVIHIVTSTISVAFARLLAERHAAAGIGYLSAPVLGRPDVAAKGELNMLVAGPEDLIRTVDPVLQPLAKKVWAMGEDPVRANAAKIACNMMITMAIEAMAEAVVLTESNGLGREDFFELILGTLFGGRAYETYSRQIVEERYQPGFKAVLGLKDLRLATEAAQQADRHLPMLDAVRGQMAKAVDAGFGDRDWSMLADITIKGA